MKKILQHCSMGIGFIFGAVALIFGILSYFVRTVGPDNIIYDGLGRQLEVVPILIRFLYLNDTMWPGFFWTVFDWVLFFGLFGLAYLMFNLSSKFEKRIRSNEQTS